MGYARMHTDWPVRHTDMWMFSPLGSGIEPYIYICETQFDIFTDVMSSYTHISLPLGSLLRDSMFLLLTCEMRIEFADLSAAARFPRVVL